MPEDSPAKTKLVDAIAGALPVKRDVVAKAFDDAMENQKLLAACTGHAFTIDLTPERKMGKRWQCPKCQGKVDQSAKHWYELGRKHQRETSRSSR